MPDAALRLHQACGQVHFGLPASGGFLRVTIRVLRVAGAFLFGYGGGEFANGRGMREGLGKTALRGNQTRDLLVRYTPRKDRRADVEVMLDLFPPAQVPFRVEVPASTF